MSDKHKRISRRHKILVVFDGKAWFIRRVRSITHDLIWNQKVYRCDEHLGGPFDSFSEVAAELDSRGWARR